jgi:predicted Na+-dependent transporter
MSGMAVSLILMVVVPTILGVTLNETSRGGIPRIISPYLGPVAKICLTLVVSANAASAAGQLHLGDPTVWFIAILCIIFSLIGFFGSSLAGKIAGLRPETGITLFFAGGMRNISAAATLAIEFFPEKAALPAILGILFQQTMAAVMGTVGGRKIDRKA